MDTTTITTEPILCCVMCEAPLLGKTKRKRVYCSEECRRRGMIKRHKEGLVGQQRVSLIPPPDSKYEVLVDLAAGAVGAMEALCDVVDRRDMDEILMACEAVRHQVGILRQRAEGLL